ncbi:MAG: HlyD family secretion protein [Clostridiales bacterium]|nr:HlyD family secretion protein [Clostridiales bacterium]
MKRKKKLITVLAIIAIVIVIVLAVVMGKKNEATGQSGQKVYISTDVVTKQALEATISTKGTVHAKESANVYSDISSEVTAIAVKEGDSVKEGDTLMTLDTETLDNQIRDAKLALQIAELQYAEATSSKVNKIAVDNANQSYDMAKQDYLDAQTLYESGAISEHELSQYKVSYDEAYHAYTAAVSAQGADQTNNKVSALELESSKNALDDLLKLKEKSIIKAPIDGTVTTIGVETYDLVAAGTAVAQIETTKDLEIETFIGEYDINKVKVGQPVKITGYGVGDSVYDGAVTFVGSSAEVQSVGQSTERSVSVKVDIQGETAFKPNFTADVDIEVAKSEEALTVPYEAVAYRDGQNYVFTVADDIAHMIPVELGVEGEILIEVKSDALQDGDVIALDPPIELEDGSAVSIIGGGL